MRAAGCTRQPRGGVDTLHPHRQHVLRRSGKPTRQLFHAVRDRDPVGRDGRRRRGGRRRAQVRDEVANREIGFVTDTGHDRQQGIEHCLRDGLLVEGPQVLDGAAATRDDQHVDFGARVRRAYRPCDFRGGSVALDRRRIQDHACGGPAAAQCGQDVVQGRGPRGGHDADGARIQRQRALARLGEPAGSLELRFQLRKFFIQRADAGQADGFDVELEFAACLVNRRRCAHLDLYTVAKRESHVLRL